VGFTSYQHNHQWSKKMNYKLTTIEIEALKKKKKSYKKADGGGLILHISGATGEKVWRYVFRFKGKQQTLTIGPYPSISLKEARRIHGAARLELQRGINPAQKKAVNKALGKIKTDRNITFEVLANQFIEEHAKYISTNSLTPLTSILNKWLFPVLGNKNILELSARDVMAAIEIIKEKGYIHRAAQSLALCGQILRFGIQQGYGEVGLRDVTQGLKVRTPAPQGFAFLSKPEEIGRLLLEIDKKVEKSPIIGNALKLAPYVFLRPSELCGGKWKEVNFEDRLWVIPAERMKKHREHVIPLSTQALEILKNIYTTTGEGEYIFPSESKTAPHIIHSTLAIAIKLLPVEGQTIHGWRKTASTTLNEDGFNYDFIERQLAHVPSNKIRGIYNKAEWLDQRKDMMQYWADKLDSWKSLVS
jgi:integrase